LAKTDNARSLWYNGPTAIRRWKMALFHERKETPNEIVLRYKYYPLFYVGMIIFVFLYVISIMFRININYVTTLLILFSVVFIADFWKPNREIRKAMKEGGVQVSGSKYSFSNPFTVVIKKPEFPSLAREDTDTATGV
jgi:hypothetical protein